jgi:acyl dehydratase
MLTAAAGEVTLVGSNIHTDAEYAREQGLAEPIADGMIATNWISSLLLRQFGEAYLSAGELRTKFIRPTLVGARVRAGFRIRERIGGEGAVRYQLDVWTEDADGATLTDGAATVELPVAD